MARQATDKQVDFAKRLINEVEGENASVFFNAHWEEGTFEDSKAASALIDALLTRKKAMPRAARVQEAMPRPGYYALPYEGVLRFYRVVEGKGKWEGRTFINRYKSDELRRVSRTEQDVVVPAILAAPLSAAMTFANETTHCYACGRRLTDATSRELGIGPECRRR